MCFFQSPLRRFQSQGCQNWIFHRMGKCESHLMREWEKFEFGRAIMSHSRIELMRFQTCTLYKIPELHWGWVRHMKIYWFWILFHSWTVALVSLLKNVPCIISSVWILNVFERYFAPFLDCLTLEDGTERFLKTSVRNYHSVLCKILGERRSHLYGRWILKSCLWVEHESELVLWNSTCLTYFYEGCMECEMLYVLFLILYWRQLIGMAAAVLSGLSREYFYIASNLNFIVHVQIMRWL